MARLILTVLPTFLIKKSITTYTNLLPVELGWMYLAWHSLAASAWGSWRVTLYEGEKPRRL
jgi:hypothetical protein